MLASSRAAWARLRGVLRAARSRLPRRRARHAEPRWAEPVRCAAMFLVTAGACVGGYLLIGKIGIIGDEWAHVKEAEDLYKYFTLGTPFVPVHPALPGYHLFLAAVSLAARSTALPLYRAATLILSALTVPVFYSVARKLGAGRLALPLALQCLFYPLLFPFYFLVYTDVVSVLVTLLCLHEILSRRYATAGLCSILMIGVRQNNVIWVGMFLLLIVIQEWKKPTWRAAVQLLDDCAIFLLGIAGLAAFIVWNGGIALADEGAHPASFHTGNVFTLCAFFAAMFLPLLFMQPRRLWELLKRYKDWMAPVLILLVFVYLWTFVNTHPYNFDQWWLRNKLLVFFLADGMRKSVFFLSVLLTLLILAISPPRQPRYWLLYPFTVLYLGSSWLVEPRYFFVPLALYLALRRPGSLRAEIALLALFVAESGVLFYGAWAHKFLP